MGHFFDDQDGEGGGMPAVDRGRGAVARVLNQGRKGGVLYLYLSKREIYLRGSRL